MGYVRFAGRFPIVEPEFAAKRYWRGVIPNAVQHKVVLRRCGIGVMPLGRAALDDAEIRLLLERGKTYV